VSDKDSSEHQGQEDYRFSICADILAFMVGTAWDVTVSGTAMLLWVWITDVCVAVSASHGCGYDWFLAFGSLSRNFFQVTRKERLSFTLSS
jgi:hypothetical protein